MESKYKEKIAEVLSVMAQTLGVELNITVVMVWCDLMASENVTIQEFQRGCWECMKTWKYLRLPAPAEILQIIRPRTSDKESAERQANIVLEQIRRIGSNGQPTFDDPITTELMQTQWRWGSLCSTLETDKVSFWRRDFVEAYITKMQCYKHLARLQSSQTSEKKLLTEGERVKT